MNVPLSYTIESERFRLRIPSANDIPRIFSATRYKGFNDGMLWDPPEEEADLLPNLAKGEEAWLKSDGFNFTIEEKLVPKLLGRISIRRTKNPKLWDVGFWTHPDSQGKGIMSEALGAILNFGFDTLGADEIQAFHAVWNKASERVLEKNGFTFVDRIDQGFMKNGVWVAEHKMILKKP